VTDDVIMTSEDFAKWLAARLEGRSNASANAEWATVAHELINGELRPAVVVGFPSGASFVLAINTVAY
jgi:deoxyribose-phosphate aldolase